MEKPLSPKEQLYKILCSYRSLLANWRMAYAPKNPEASLHPCFVASLHYADRVQYLLDILLQGSPNEKQQLLNGKEVTVLGKAIERCKEAEDPGISLFYTRLKAGTTHKAGTNIINRPLKTSYDIRGKSLCC